jgi:hypothetical protein
MAYVQETDVHFGGEFCRDPYRTVDCIKHINAFSSDRDLPLYWVYARG